MATGGHLQVTSDEYIEYECTVCLKNNKVKNADRYCFDCQKYMCSECLRIHNTFSETHNVLSVTDKKVQNVLTEKCGDHPDKLLELYCRQHDVVLCQTCLLLDHRTCSNVKDIVELSDPEIHAIDSHLQYSLDHLNQVINALGTHLGHIQQKEESYLNELEDYARKILSKIKELKNRGKDDMSATTRQLKSMAEEHLHACEKLKDDLSKYTQEISSANKRNAHVFVLQKKSQAITRRIESLCRDSERMIKEATFSFRLNLQVAVALYDFNSLLVKGEKYECIRVIRCNIKLPKDKLECDIRGCCRLGDGSLLLVDGNNKRLKRVHPNSSAVTEHYDMTDSPSDVCIISPHEVAVATGSSTIRVFTHVDNLAQSRETKICHKTFNLAHHNAELFTGSLTGDSYLKTLYVCDESGNLKEEISKDSSGLCLFSNIKGITVSDSGEKIYVTDWRGGLICLSRDSREIFRLTEVDLGLSGAYGVAMDHNGHVFVSGFRSNNVVQVTEEGTVIGEIISQKNGVMYPECLCYDEKRQRLYVGGESNHIIGFDLM